MIPEPFLLPYEENENSLGSGTPSVGVATVSNAAFCGPFIPAIYLVLPTCQVIRDLFFTVQTWNCVKKLQAVASATFFGSEICRKPGFFFFFFFLPKR